MNHARTQLSQPQPRYCLTPISTQLYLSDLSSSFFPSIPVSPPAPHRKAPKPPVYSPRRNRARHINMTAPAQLGLFTVLESEEESYNHNEIMYNIPSATASSEVFPTPSPSPAPSSSSLNRRNIEAWRTAPINVPRDIDEDMEMDAKLNRLSWSSKGSLMSNTAFTEGETEHEITTPLMESEDPFGWSTSIPFSSDSFEPDVEMTEDTLGGHLYTPTINTTKSPTLAESIKMGNSARRPPPLTLTTRFLTPVATPTSANSHNNLFSAISNASSAESDLILTPRTATSPTSGSLLPSLPIISSIEWASRSYAPKIGSPVTPTKCRKPKSKSTKRKSPDDHIDLATALEDLLTSCGEKFECSSSDSEFSGPSPTTPSSSSDSDLDGFESRSMRFPLPPTRSTSSANFKTPLPSRKSTSSSSNRPAAPYAPKKDRRSGRSSNDSNSPLSLKSDHSFLNSLSTGQEFRMKNQSFKSLASSSTSSSIGSSSSRKSLPDRKALPVEWTRF